MSHLAQAREVFDIELAALKDVRAQLDRSFDRAVENIVEALKQRGKIVIVGIGKSGNVGQKIAATLTSTGSTSVVLNSVDALHGDVGIVNDGDVILALSYSGESEELLNLLPALKRFSVKIISLTGNVKSSLARHSDVSLNVKVPKEACPFNLAPTSQHDRDARHGRRAGDGGFGRRAASSKKILPNFIRAARLAARCCSKSATSCARATATPWRTKIFPSRKRLLVMTHAKSGSSSVVNARGKLAGVFTDGDFRRHMAANENLLSLPLKNVMTPKPDLHPRKCARGRSAENFQRAEH